MDNNTKEVLDRTLDMAQSSGDAIHDAITQLASMLGVGATQVYATLVKQAYYEGIIGCVIMGVSLIVWIVLCICAWKMWNKHYAAEEPKQRKSYEERAFSLTVIAGLIGVALILPCLIVGSDVITKVLNPDYYAIKEATNMVSAILHKDK